MHVSYVMINIDPINIMMHLLSGIWIKLPKVSKCFGFISVYYLTYKAVIVVFDNNWLKEKDVTQDMVYYHPLFNYVIHHSVHNYVCGSSSNKGVIIRCPT